ncbi:MAG: hypothetical protein ACJAZX_000788 [Rickettsiales bacterium]|jgi:uncharacterized protein
MDITPQVSKDLYSLEGYGSEGFKINDRFYKSSIILTPSQIIEVKIDSLEDFFEQNLSEILEKEPEILLIGTGKNHRVISASLKNKIKSFYPKISIDEMSTGSACRTYNILMSEDRHVAAFLIAD